MIVLGNGRHRARDLTGFVIMFAFVNVPAIILSAAACRLEIDFFPGILPHISNTAMLLAIGVNLNMKAMPLTKKKAQNRNSGSMEDMPILLILEKSGN